MTGETLIGDSGGTASSAEVTSLPATVSTEGDVTLKADNNWTLRSSCVIGDNTKGKLTIDSGSTVNANNNNVTLGSQKTGNGTLTVNGDGAALKKIKSLQVGVDGTGTVLIENGGSLGTTGAAYVGVNASQGSLMVLGGGVVGIDTASLSAAMERSPSPATRGSALAVLSSPRGTDT